LARVKSEVKTHFSFWVAARRWVETTVRVETRRESYGLAAQSGTSIRPGDFHERGEKVEITIAVEPEAQLPADGSPS